MSTPAIPPSPLAAIATGRSFADRVGQPDAFSSSLGYVVLSFAWLELLLSRYIAMLLTPSEPAATAVTSELPFQKKVHLLASLVRLNPRKLWLNHGRPDPSGPFSTIVADCFRAEEMRNLILHSSWESVPLEPERMLRFKHTAKAKKGLQTQVEHLDAAIILDVADFIDRVSDDLDIFFLPKPLEM